MGMTAAEILARAQQQAMGTGYNVLDPKTTAAGTTPTATGTPMPTTPGATLPPAVPSTPGDPNAGLAPMTGFASRYAPAMADQAYENPWYILKDVFPGITESQPGYQALRDMGGDPLTLFNILMGGQQKIDQGAGAFINWLANMYGERGKAGGKGFDADQLIQTLFGQTKFGADSENTLGQILGAGDMSTQIRTLFNMARDASNVSQNPLAARGYQAALAQAGDRYGNAQMQADAGDTMNPAQWIATNMPWLAGR